MIDARLLEAAAYQRLDDEIVTMLDQRLFRCGKLQDAMGQRLFPALLQVGQEWQEHEAFLDKLNRLGMK